MKRIKKLLLCMILLLSFMLVMPAQAQAAVKINKKTASVTVGKTVQLKISGTTKKVKWSSNKTSVATVTQKGKVTAKKKGTATITAKIGSKKYTCKVTVKAAPAVMLSDKTKTLTVGQNFNLILKNTTSSVKWSTSNKNVAAIKKVSKYKYKVTAKKAGTATVTVTVGKKKYSCKVTVKAVSISEKVALPTNKQIYTGNGVTIKTTNITEDGTYIKIGLYIENNSSLSLGLNAHSYAVNGIMSEDSIYYMDCDVPAGKKANTTLNIKKTWLQESGIQKIQQLDILIWAYDNAKSYYAFDTGVISIGNGCRQYLSGQTVYNKNGVYVKKSKVQNGEYYFIIGNSGNSYFDFDVEDISINDFGYSKYIYWGNEQVLPGCERLVSFKLDSSFLGLNGISKVDKIEFCLENIYERDYYNPIRTDIVIISYSNFPHQ